MGSMSIEVALAMPEKQELLKIKMSSGSTVAQAIDQSGILSQFDGIEVDPTKVGIFGHMTDMDQVLRDGDRVEIYRALIADPKEIRRQRAKEQAEQGLT